MKVSDQKPRHLVALAAVIAGGTTKPICIAASEASPEALSFCVLLSILTILVDRLAMLNARGGGIKSKENVMPMELAYDPVERVCQDASLRVSTR